MSYHFYGRGDPELDLPSPDPEFYDACACHVCGTLRSLFGSAYGSESQSERPRRVLFTTTEVAEVFGVGEGTVRRLVSEGELRTVAIGSYSRRRIPQSEISDYVDRLLTGELRAWVDARRELHRWGLRYMQDRWWATDKNGRRSQRGGRKFHMGDGRTPLCGDEPRGQWETTMDHWWVSGRLCNDCEQLSYRLTTEKRERKKRPPIGDLIPMLTVVEYEGGGQAIRKKGWHYGDGKTTLCGLKRDKWELPKRRPRAKPCGVCSEAAGLT